MIERECIPSVLCKDLVVVLWDAMISKFKMFLENDLAFTLVDGVCWMLNSKAMAIRMTLRRTWSIPMAPKWRRSLSLCRYWKSERIR